MLGVYRAVLRLLPESFRRRWMAEAEDDVRSAIERARAERGRPAAWWAALRACGDVLRTVPGEWWRAARAKGAGRRDGGRRRETMRTWIQDLRIAARSLARRPGFALVATLTLACGIGANTAIFSVVNAVLLRPLPYPQSDRLVGIDHHAPAIGLPVLNNSPGTLAFYEAHGDFLQGIAAYGATGRNVLLGDRPERLDVLEASPSLLDVLGVRPASGRALTAADAEPGAAPVALLSHDLWTRRLGGDPAVLGTSVRIEGVPTEIVGVLPEGFAFPDPDPVLLTPLELDPDAPFGAFGVQAVGHLAPGLTLQAAQRRASELQALMPDFFGDLDATFLEGAGWSVTVEGMRERVVGEDVASTLWVVLGTVGLVLLIACANVANLFLVRAESRRKEVAVRAALGAGRGRIASMFLSEAWILGAAGGALGLAVGWVGVRLLASGGPLELPRAHEIAVDGTTVLFTVALSLLTALVFGSFPLLKLGRRGFGELLRDGGRGATAGRERHRARNLLVAGQLALALVLLVGSGLMVRSFQALRSVDAGIDPSDVLTVGISLGEEVDPSAGATFYQEVADRVGALPGVASVGITTFVPLGGDGAHGGGLYIESKPADESALPQVAMYKAVGGDYLGALRHRLVEGRPLERADVEGGEPVALVNQAFADRLLEGRALGEGVKWDESLPFARIVGVVANAREFELTEEPDPWVYLPLVVGGWGYPSMEHAFVLVRTDPGGVLPAAAVREVVAELDPSVPITTVSTMDEVVADEVAATSFTVTLLGIAAAMALFLGSIGLFGVISYVVGQRTREIGVRMALGARARDIEAMVLRQAGAVVVAGVAAGLLGAVALTRLMSALLYEVSATDPLAFVAAPVLLSAVAMLAAFVPARRASRVEPTVALQSE